MKVFENADEKLWEIIENKENPAEREGLKEEFSALKKAGHALIVLFLYDFVKELNNRGVPHLVYGHFFPAKIATILFDLEKNEKWESERAYDGKTLALYIEIQSDRKDDVDALIKRRYENAYHAAYYSEILGRYLVSIGTYYLSNGSVKKPCVDVKGETCIVKGNPGILQNIDAQDGFYFALLPKKRVGSYRDKKILDSRIYERELSYNILRGETKIGENLIEIMGYDKRILLECGKALFPDEKTAKMEEIVRKEEYDAIVLSHAHEDHSGLLKEPLAAKTIYMGERTLAVLQEKDLICQENVEKVVIMKGEEPFFVGEIRFFPHFCDHSSLDSYMIEISDNVKTFLYTGDFRSNGRKNFDALLRRLPEKVDVLICERTTGVGKNETEWDLEEKAVEIMREHKEAFLLQSAENADRMVSFYRACKRTGGVFLMTPLHAQLTRHIENVPNPQFFSDCYLYFPRKMSEEVYENIRRRYGQKLVGREQIADMEKFSMLVTSGMLDYLTKLSEKRDLSHAVLIYSLWDGYKEKMKEFLTGIEKLGIRIVDLHVSGHADKEAIDALIARTNPTEIRFVHTDREKV